MIHPATFRDELGLRPCDAVIIESDGVHLLLLGCDAACSETHGLPATSRSATAVPAGGVAFGLLPRALFKEIARRFADAVEERLARVTPRTQ